MFNKLNQPSKDFTHTHTHTHTHPKTTRTTKKTTQNYRPRGETDRETHERTL